MKIKEVLINDLKGLKNDHRGVLFYITALGTLVYLAMLYYRFFASPGMTIQVEGKGLYLALLSGYTTATQVERAQGGDYKKRPGELLAACWVASALFFWFVNPVFRVGDPTVLSEIVGAGPNYVIDWVLGLLGVNYAFRTQLVQKIGQAMVGVPGSGKGNATPPTPSSS